MKTKVTIDAINHEDLVNLFSTALSGSTYLGADYEEAVEHNEVDCFEDILANILLHGGKVMITDYYAEGDVHGNLPHEMDEDENVTYFVTLDDIKRGLEKAAGGGCSFSREAFNSFIDEDRCDFDLWYADALMQEILFGEVIYG